MKTTINNIKVSVIVPVCNVEKYLAQALQSVCSQTHKNLEIIVLNDGSKDGSMQIINEFAKKDCRIISVDKDNEGYGKTCNRGLSIATGDYIAILEPDDWITKNMYSEMLQFVWRDDLLCNEDGKTIPDIDVVKTPWIEVRNWDKPSKQYEVPGAMFKYIKTTKNPITLHDCTALIEFHPSIWTCLYKKSFLDKFNIKFPEYPGAGWADNPFLIDTLYQAHSIMYLDKPFYHYRADLLGSTRNHNTDEKIALPFNRWLDMTAKLKQLGCSDDKIWNSHYVRGFNYIHGALVDDGWDNEIVRLKIKEVFSSMQPKFVINNPRLSTESKEFYKVVTDYDGKIPKEYATRIARMLSSDMALIRQYGVIQLLQRIRMRNNIIIRSISDKKTFMDKIANLHSDALEADAKFKIYEEKHTFKTPRSIKRL